MAELKTRPIWNTKSRLEKLEETREERLKAYREMCNRFYREHDKNES